MWLPQLHHAWNPSYPINPPAGRAGTAINDKTTEGSSPTHGGHGKQAVASYANNRPACAIQLIPALVAAEASTTKAESMRFHGGGPSSDRFVWGWYRWPFLGGVARVNCKIDVPHTG